MTFIQEVLDTKRGVLLGAIVNGFEEDLDGFVNKMEISPLASLGRNDNVIPSLCAK